MCHEVLEKLGDHDDPLFELALELASGLAVVAPESGEDGFLERQKGVSHASALDTLIDDDSRQRLVAAIDDLPEREKLVTGLYYEQELNLKEIGEILEIPEKTVKSRLFTARQRLRVILTERGVTP